MASRREQLLSKLRENLAIASKAIGAVPPGPPPRSDPPPQQQQFNSSRRDSGFGQENFGGQRPFDRSGNLGSSDIDVKLQIRAGSGMIHSATVGRYGESMNISSEVYPADRGSSNGGRYPVMSEMDRESDYLYSSEAPFRPQDVPRANQSGFDYDRGSTVPQRQTYQSDSNRMEPREGFDPDLYQNVLRLISQDRNSTKGGPALDLLTMNLRGQSDLPPARDQPDRPSVRTQSDMPPMRGQPDITPMRVQSDMSPPIRPNPNNPLSYSGPPHQGPRGYDPRHPPVQGSADWPPELHMRPPPIVATAETSLPVTQKPTEESSFWKNMESALKLAESTSASESLQRGGDQRTVPRMSMDEKKQMTADVEEMMSNMTVLQEAMESLVTMKTSLLNRSKDEFRDALIAENARMQEEVSTQLLDLRRAVEEIANKLIQDRATTSDSTPIARPTENLFVQEQPTARAEKPIKDDKPGKKSKKEKSTDCSSSSSSGSSSSDSSQSRGKKKKVPTATLR